MKIFAGIKNVFQAVLQRLIHGQYYRVTGDVISIDGFPGSSFNLSREQIKRWSIIPEMGVDFVQIELFDGRQLLLSDKTNCLISALKLIAIDRKIGDELELL